MKKTIVIAGAVVLVVLAAVFAAGCVSEPAKTVTCYDDLIGAKIAVQTGTTGDYEVTAIADANPGTTVERFNKIVDGVQSLKNGKVDCAVVDIETAKNYVSEGSGLKIIEDPAFVPEEYAFAVKKNRTQFLNELNTAIAELQEDGTFDKINKYYLGSNAASSMIFNPLPSVTKFFAVSISTTAQSTLPFFKD